MGIKEDENLKGKMVKGVEVIVQDETLRETAFGADYFRELLETVRSGKINLETDNPYAIEDIEMIKTDVGRYMNIISIVGNLKKKIGGNLVKEIIC
jgi:hypothetical protein